MSHQSEFEFVSFAITKSIQEFVGSDAAADELKAMRLAKNSLFKNIKVSVRDGAHAAGRWTV